MNPSLPHPLERPWGKRPHCRRASVGVLLAVALVLFAACDPRASNDATTTGCANFVREASVAQEVDDQIALLDDALLTCRSYGALATELAKYPGIIGYDTATFVSLRCANVSDEAIRTGPTCVAVIDPTTTIPSTTLPALIFVGQTLDGRQVILRASDGIEFVGEVPAIVQQTVDIAFESGCDGVMEQRDLWATRIDDPVEGDVASVYAQHAQNVLDYIGCESEPIDVG